MLRIHFIQEKLTSQQPVAELTPVSGVCVPVRPCHYQDSWVHLYLSGFVNVLMSLSFSVSPSALGETVQLCNLTV